jgi:misacylated tRNA(Ala) deacylase
MTTLLAHTDAYLKEFEANVTAVSPDENAVALTETAFYPGGGGQPCDFGWLGDTPVTKVKRQGARCRLRIQLCMENSIGDAATN